MNTTTENITKTTPKASVVLPVYNGEKYLAEAIESVLNQTFRDFELILLNDGSTDDSLKIMRHYQSIDNRCKIISRENKGLIYTLNEGIELSKSEIIIRMDADDICVPDRFEKQIEFFEKYPDCVSVGSRIISMDEDGMHIRLWPLPLDHTGIDGQNIIGMSGGIAHPAAVFRKQAIQKIGGYDEKYKYAEDLDLFLKLAEIGKLANIEKPLLYYRQHLDSVCFKYADQQNISVKKATADAMKRRGITDHKKIETHNAAGLDNLEIYRIWAWWAIGDKNFGTAKKYGKKLLFKKPFSIQTWKIWYCIFRGY